MVKSVTWVMISKLFTRPAPIKTSKLRKKRLFQKGVVGEISYQFANTFLKPKFSLEGGYSSGDKSLKDDVVGVFRSSYPNLRFAGVTTTLGPGNSMGLNPTFTIFPTRAIIIELSGRFLWRTNTNDGSHSPAGFPVTAPANNKPFIGGGGGSKPFYPELAKHAPGAIIIDRTNVNAWEEAEFVAAVKATGRKKSSWAVYGPTSVSPIRPLRRHKRAMKSMFPKTQSVVKLSFRI